MVSAAVDCSKRLWLLAPAFAPGAAIASDRMQPIPGAAIVQFIRTEFGSTRTRGILARVRSRLLMMEQEPRGESLRQSPAYGQVSYAAPECPILTQGDAISAMPNIGRASARAPQHDPGDGNAISSP
jgi:hypothetical protein